MLATESNIGWLMTVEGTPNGLMICKNTEYIANH